MASLFPGTPKLPSLFAFFTGQPFHHYFIQSHFHPFHFPKLGLSPVGPSQNSPHPKAPSNHPPSSMEGTRGSETASPLLTPAGV